MVNYPPCNPTDTSCIEIKDANSLLDQHEVIRDNVFTTRNIIKRKKLFKELETVHSDDNPSFIRLYRKLINFFKLKSNIYIFDYEHIQTLMKEVENDPDGKATHIMIIDGAQQSESAKGFQIGQSTTIIIPCRKDKSKKDEEAFVSVGNKGREHPQTRYARTIPVKKGENKIEVHIV